MLRYLYFPTLLLFGLLVFGCLSPEKFQQKNDPDTVVKFASRRLDGKRLKTDWAKVLETSFAQANEADMRRIGELKALGTVADWEQIHAIAEQLEHRHQRVTPLLPIVSEDGYRPDIRLLPIGDLLTESRREVIERSVPDIEEKLRLAQNGQRLQARMAHERIAALRKKYGWNDAVADSLQSEARNFGSTYVLLEVEQNRSIPYGDRVEERLDFKGIRSGNSWQVVHRSEQPGTRYDFSVKVELAATAVSRELLNTTWTTVAQEVQVGQEAVKDSNGVVICYKPIFQTVCATIQHVQAAKDASLTAHVEVFDLATGKSIHRKTLWETDSFAQSLCSYTGDSRVSATSGCGFSTHVFFPSDWQMMDNCADDLRFSLFRLLKKVDLTE